MAKLIDLQGLDAFRDEIVNYISKTGNTHLAYLEYSPTQLQEQEAISNMIYAKTHNAFVPAAAGYCLLRIETTKIFVANVNFQIRVTSGDILSENTANNNIYTFNIDGVTSSDSAIEVAAGSYLMYYDGNGTFSIVTDGGIPGFSAAGEIDSIILVSNTQPTEEANKIWFNPSAEEEYSVPTYSEFNEARNALAPKADPVFTGSITIGGATMTEQDLADILDVLTNVQRAAGGDY